VRTLSLVALAIALLTAAGASAAGAAGSFRLVVVGRGFDNPVLPTRAPGEPKTLYVVEQPGRILKVAGRRRTVFLDVKRLVDFGGERGLLGLAFSPRYARDHTFYVAYTTASENVVARYRSARGLAVPESARIVFSTQDPYSNHNGGNLAFGPDGGLYTSIGDGGSGGDPEDRAQNVQSQFGKLLRLDPRSASPSWTIAALGLRNPWRFTFDRATGDLYIGDVGQNEVEEVDFTPRRSPGLENYGWDLYEGTHRYEDTPQGPGKLVSPVFEYAHEDGSCTVVGGLVYRGKARPALRGRYVFGDYCSGSVWSLRIKAGKATSTRRERFRISGLTSFGEDAAGELYAVSQDGTLYRLS